MLIRLFPYVDNVTSTTTTTNSQPYFPLDALVEKGELSYTSSAGTSSGPPPHNLQPMSLDIGNDEAINYALNPTMSRYVDSAAQNPQLFSENKMYKKYVDMTDLLIHWHRPTKDYCLAIVRPDGINTLPILWTIKTDDFPRHILRLILHPII